MHNHWMIIAVLGLPTVFLSCQDAEEGAGGVDAVNGPDGQADWAWTYIDEMQTAVSSAPQLAQINAQEALVAELNAGLLSDWRAAWQAADADAYGRLLHSPSADLAWDQGVTLHRERGGIAEYRWAPGSADSSAHIASYLSQFAHIADLRLETTAIELTEAGAQLRLRLDLRGEDTSGHRRHDRGMLALSVVQAEDRWLIAGLKAIELERLSAQRAPAYVDVSEAWGLADIPVTDRREAIRRGGYALSVVDYDGDTRPDLLFGDYGPVQLLRNTGTRFEQVDVGLGTEDSVKSSAIVDLDNDGDRDLLLLRFAYGDGPLGDMVAYRNDAGRFTRVDRPLPRHRTYDRAMPLTLADFDKDGRVDVYIGFPGTMDFTNNLEAATRPETLASQGIWFNEGDWKFKEADASHAIVKSNQVYSHGAVASDIDLDGHIDIVVVDDSGRINPVYKNDGAGHFDEVSKSAGLQSPGWSMGISTGDFDGDGHLDILSTNIALSAGQRILNSAKAGTGIDKLDTLRMEYVGAQLYRNNGDGSFSEISAQAGLDWVGDAAAGAEFVDYDHDGLLDIYITNGLWTGGDKDLDSVFIRGVTGVYGDDDPHQADVHGGQPVFGKMGPDYATGEAPTPNPMLTALRNHIDAQTGAPTWSLAGKQRNRLFRNNGDGSFTEVGYLEGADRIEDGYVVAPADVDQDGRQDLVLRNCDPAPGVTMATVRLLRNQLPQTHSLSVSLTGTQSNRDGLGAVVIATVGKRRLVREVRATNGAVQGEPVAFFGLGDAQQVDQLEIRWPSGTRQIFSDIDQGSVALTEGVQRIAR